MAKRKKSKNRRRKNTNSQNNSGSLSSPTRKNETQKRFPYAHVIFDILIIAVGIWVANYFLWGYNPLKEDSSPILATSSFAVFSDCPQFFPFYNVQPDVKTQISSVNIDLSLFKPSDQCSHINFHIPEGAKNITVIQSKSGEDEVFDRVNISKIQGAYKVFIEKDNSAGWPTAINFRWHDSIREIGIHKYQLIFGFESIYSTMSEFMRTGPLEIKPINPESKRIYKALLDISIHEKLELYKESFESYDKTPVTFFRTNEYRYMLDYNSDNRELVLEITNADSGTHMTVAFMFLAAALGGLIDIFRVSIMHLFSKLRN